MKNLLLLAGLALVIGGCAPRVTVDSANVNFKKYRTYDWMDADVKAGQNPVYYNQIANQNVEDVINEALTKRGIQKNTRRPDLLIGYHFFVEEKTRTVSTPGNYGPLYGSYYGWGRWGYRGWGPGWYGYNFGNNQYVQEEYKAGTVVVDMVDARTRKLVWRGTTENVVNNPARIKEQLAREIKKIVEKFPAGRAS